MESVKQKPELLTIVGPTASGKSELAMRIAQEFNGEIITADSRTIYKRMDIGTAKPSKEDRQQVLHWGIDLIELGESFSAYKFKKYAQIKITEIQKRKKLPILVGGTGLYIDSILFDFEFGKPVNLGIRHELESLATEELQKRIQEKQYLLPENFRNRRYLIRTLEREGKTGDKSRIKNNTFVIGLLPSTEALRQRINHRAQEYFARGLAEETESLIKKYGENKILKSHGIAYAAAIKLLKNELSRREAVVFIQKEEWQYARRQRTWFKRNKFIHWYQDIDSAYQEIASILNN